MSDTCQHSSLAACVSVRVWGCAVWPVRRSQFPEVGGRLSLARSVWFAGALLLEMPATGATVADVFECVWLPSRDAVHHDGHDATLDITTGQHHEPTSCRGRRQKNTPNVPVSALSHAASLLAAYQTDSSRTGKEGRRTASAAWGGAFQRVDRRDFAFTGRFCDETQGWRPGGLHGCAPECALERCGDVTVERENTPTSLPCS